MVRDLIIKVFERYCGMVLKKKYTDKLIKPHTSESWQILYKKSTMV